MKKFSAYIVGGLLVILIVMTVLDFVFTKIYETSYPRTKFQYLRSLKHQKVDYIFIGSSRVENGIVPSIIKKKTGKEAVNLGFQAAKLGDVYTLLQLIKAFDIHYETILIQVDYIYNIEGGHSNIFEYEMMPFVRENEVSKAYLYQFVENPQANYYMPFYRYCKNDLKIGFREIFANSIRKKTNVILQKGYVGRYGNATELTGALPAEILNKNTTLDIIQFFIKKNKLKVYFYFAPVCKNSKNQDFISKLKTKIPELIDLSRALNDDAFFLDCNHLNNAGAERFTEILVEEVLMKKSK